MLKSIYKIIFSFIICTFLLLIINPNIFRLNPIIFNDVVYLKKYEIMPPGFYSEEAIALSKLSKKLTRKSIVALSNPECFRNEESKSFIYSAFLEARIWNECHMYSSSTKSGQNYLSSLFKDNNYRTKDDPLDRYKVAFEFANSNIISQENCMIIKNINNWTHFLVNKRKLDKIGNCLKDLENNKEGDFVLYNL